MRPLAQVAGLPPQAMRVDEGASPVVLESLLYQLLYHRFERTELRGRARPTPKPCALVCACAPA